MRALGQRFPGSTRPGSPRRPVAELREQSEVKNLNRYLFEYVFLAAVFLQYRSLTRRNKTFRPLQRLETRRI